LPNVAEQALFRSRRVYASIRIALVTTNSRDVVRPRALFAGARVALVAPAGPVDADRIERATTHCRALGLEPVVFPAALARREYLAGSDEERLGDLQSAFDDPSIDAVWALRGGYGTLRILDRLDLDRQHLDPIPFIGFSDNTTLHVRHAGLGVISFHGPHPGADFPPETADWFRRVLFEASPAGALPVRPEDPQPRCLVAGRVEAPLFGGNVAMLASLCGSKDAGSARGRILVLEDVGEPAYRVDRMLTQLARAGMMQGVVGLALGRFTDPPEGEAERLRAAVEEFARRWSVPTVADLPFGHVEHNCTLPIGARAVLDADRATLALSEPAVQG
jgi:muramoyltetrapeptide carboxypeptidase